MSRLHLVMLAGLLAALGLAFFAYKVLHLGFPLTPEARTEVWRIEVGRKPLPERTIDGQVAPEELLGGRPPPDGQELDELDEEPGLSVTRLAHGLHELL